MATEAPYFATLRAPSLAVRLKARQAFPSSLQEKASPVPLSTRPATPPMEKTLAENESENTTAQENPVEKKTKKES